MGVWVYGCMGEWVNGVYGRVGVDVWVYKSEFYGCTDFRFTSDLLQPSNLLQIRLTVQRKIMAALSHTHKHTIQTQIQTQTQFCLPLLRAHLNAQRAEERKITLATRGQAGIIPTGCTCVNGSWVQNGSCIGCKMDLG